jgi:4-amino-4-deoxy-L-arabinose transferase-like glycosyltransferase
MQMGIADLNHRDGKIVAVVLAFAFIVRLVWALLVPVIPISDSAAYDTFALNLAEHGTYGWTAGHPSAYWPVGTSAIYAALYWIFGHSYVPVVALNIVLGVAIVGLTIWIGRLFFDDKIAIIAGGLMAIWPSQVAYVTILASELPFTLLVLLGFYGWFSRRLSVSRPVTVGLAFGLASYIRPIALLLSIVLWLTAIPRWHSLREQLPKLLLVMCVIGITIAPWSARNTKLFGHFVLLSTNGGPVTWMGNNPASDGYYMPLPASTDGLNEYERDKALGEQAMQYIKAEPLAFVLRTIKKAVLLHVSETIAVHWNMDGIKQRFGEGALFPFKVITQTFWFGVLLFAIAGFLALVWERGIVLALLHPLVMTWNYFTAVYAVTAIQDRYHFPSQPFIALLTGVAIMAIGKWVISRSRASLRYDGNDLVRGVKE